MNGKRYGKILEQFKIFIEHCAAGKKSLVIAPEYVVMPTAQYEALLSERTKLREALEKVVNFKLLQGKLDDLRVMAKTALGSAE